MENFGCLNSSFCFYFVTNLRKKKKNYGVRTRTFEPFPSPHTSQCAFSWTTSPHSERKYLMVDPMKKKIEPISFFS